MTKISRLLRINPIATEIPNIYGISIVKYCNEHSNANPGIIIVITV
jgi:hypothetical protein